MSLVGADVIVCREEDLVQPRVFIGFYERIVVCGQHCDSSSKKERCCVCMFYYCFTTVCYNCSLQR